MKNKDILNLINENKIDELKAKIIAEIGLEDNKEIPTYKAIQRLANLAEKAQRTSKRRFDGKYIYSRPAIAGAYYKGDKTVIMDMCWGLIINEKLTGLTMAEDSANAPDLQNLMPTDTDNVEKYEKIPYTKAELNGLKNLLKIDKNHTVRFDDNTYPTSQFVNIAECLEDVCIYAPKTKYNPLVIKGTNGIALICAMRV